MLIVLLVWLTHASHQATIVGFTVLSVQHCFLCDAKSTLPSFGELVLPTLQPLIAGELPAIVFHLHGSISFVPEWAPKPSLPNNIVLEIFQLELGIMKM